MIENNIKTDKLTDLTREAMHKETLLCKSCHEKLTLLSDAYKKKSPMKKMIGMDKYIQEIHACLCPTCKKIIWKK